MPQVLQKWCLMTCLLKVYVPMSAADAEMCTLSRGTNQRSEPLRAQREQLHAIASLSSPSTSIRSRRESESFLQAACAFQRPSTRERDGDSLPPARSRSDGRGKRYRSRRPRVRRSDEALRSFPSKGACAFARAKCWPQRD